MQRRSWVGGRQGTAVCFFVVLLLAAAPIVSAFGPARKIAGRKSSGPSSRGCRLASDPEERVDDDVASADITSGGLARLDISKPTSPVFQAADFLNPLTQYSDDGFTLSAPQRYSIQDWFKNLVSLPMSGVLARVAERSLPNLLRARPKHGPC